MRSMIFDLKPASDSPLPDLVKLMNRGFEREELSQWQMRLVLARCADGSSPAR